MNTNLKSIEIECECGAEHVLRKFELFENITSFVNLLLKLNVKFVRLFASDYLKKSIFIDQLIFILNKHSISLKIDFLKVNYAEVVFAKSIKHSGEDYVVVFGESDVIDIVKYYAASESLNYSIISAGEFFDFTFSKFARLYDGVSFCFYRCNEPDGLIISDDFLQLVDLDKIKQYFLIKSMANFENNIYEKVFDGKYCSKIKNKIEKILKMSLKINKKRDILLISIYVGRLMSFFDCTFYFYGAEIDLANIIQVKTKDSFLNCYLFSHNAISMLYKICVSRNLKWRNFDLNRRIGKIKKVLGLPASKCLEFIKKPKSIKFLNTKSIILNAYKYKFLELLNKYDSPFFNNYQSVCLINSLYIAPEISVRYTFLNFIRDLGCLENLW